MDWRRGFSLSTQFICIRIRRRVQFAVSAYTRTLELLLLLWRRSFDVRGSHSFFFVVAKGLLETRLHPSKMWINKWNGWHQLLLLLLFSFCAAPDCSAHAHNMHLFWFLSRSVYFGLHLVHRHQIFNLWFVFFSPNKVGTCGGSTILSSCFYQSVRCVTWRPITAQCEKSNVQPKNKFAQVKCQTHRISPKWMTLTEWMAEWMNETKIRTNSNQFKYSVGAWESERDFFL